MRTTPTHDNVFDLNALLHPGTVFSHPREVVADPNLSLAEKRAILASWASDASAIASCPALRSPDGLKAPVHRRNSGSATRARRERSAQPAGRQAHASALGRASRGGVSEGSASDFMTDVTQLIPGRFYWVLVRSSTKHPEWQAARFAGATCQGDGAKWDFIGFNSDVDHLFIEVVDIGSEILSV